MSTNWTPEAARLPLLVTVTAKLADAAGATAALSGTTATATSVDLATVPVAVAIGTSRPMRVVGADLGGVDELRPADGRGIDEGGHLE